MGKVQDTLPHPLPRFSNSFQISPCRPDVTILVYVATSAAQLDNPLTLVQIQQKHLKLNGALLTPS